MSIGTNQISGIKFPFQFVNGRVAVSTGEQHIKECVMHLISTGKLEYLMKPDYGTEINSRIFDPINVVPLMEADIKTAIRRYEPRVELVDINAIIDVNNPGVVHLSIEIKIKGGLNPISIDMKVRR